LPRRGELTVWTPTVVQEHEKRIRASAWWNVVARLAPGVTMAQAQSEMDAISAELARQYPRTNAASRPVLVSMREHLTGGVSVPLFLMLAAVVLVFGIGCLRSGRRSGLDGSGSCVNSLPRASCSRSWLPPSASGWRTPR
jgi:hypothetical protein